MGNFLKKLNSTFLNTMRSEIVSLGVWGSKEIIYHYDFIPSSTLFRSMKFRTKKEHEVPQHEVPRISIFFPIFPKLHDDNKG